MTSERMRITKSSAGWGGITRVMVFIDGGYLRKRLKETFGNDKIDYGKLVNMLRADTMYGPLFPKLIRAYYYDSIPKRRDKKAYEEQIGYLNRVADNDFIEIRTGRLKSDGAGKPRQKSVDTLIAIDMLSNAYEDHFDVAVLIAGDDDFLDLTKAVENAGKQVYGAFFIGHISQDLMNTFDRRLFLNAKNLVKSHAN